ncbi:hypothetical protein MRB53_029016 [Persea americana]|uniref:Uncharacterized protein n=1 Tax=Persea americana TaxID=3435 RepID=A0ACC2KH53_PERAE|nr:hypothetical protein MRB53_029016 [Persea americana]
MIKRRFYKDEHADRNDVSDSSSSSDDESDSTKEDEEEEEEETIVAEKPNSPTLGSGYESEDSSGNEVDCDSSGKGHAESAAGKRSTDAVKAFNNAKDTAQADFDDCVEMQQGNSNYWLDGVWDWKVCGIHLLRLESFCTATSAVANNENLLTLFGYVTCDGEIEEDRETHAERHARIVALAENLTHQKKKNEGRQRQRERLKKRLRDASKEGKASESMKKPTKKKRKI